MRNELNAGAVPVRSYGASLGRIARSHPNLSAGRGAAANEGLYKGVSDNADDEAAAWSLRARNASGFGDADTDLGVALRSLTAERLHADARLQRSRLIAATANRAIRFLRDRISRFVAEFKRSREERRTYLALSQIDSRTLRDIGIDRGEIRSIAIEIAGGHPATRIHAHRAIASRNS